MGCDHKVAELCLKPRDGRCQWQIIGVALAEEIPGQLLCGFAVLPAPSGDPSVNRSRGRWPPLKRMEMDPNGESTVPRCMTKTGHNCSD